VNGSLVRKTLQSPENPPIKSWHKGSENYAHCVLHYTPKTPFSAQHSSGHFPLQRSSFQHFSFTQILLFPALRFGPAAALGAICQKQISSSAIKFLTTFSIFAATISFMGVFCGCSESRSNTDPVPPANSIVMNNIWVCEREFGNGSEVFLVYEFENAGSRPIKAFQGTATFFDDLDNVLSELKFQYTSDTVYVTKESKKPSHIIKPGEEICFVIEAAFMDTAPSEKNVFAIAKVDLPMLKYFKELQPTKRKTTAEFTKIAYAE
jgi:hypothetical protein